MAMHFCSLGSGSAGNATVVEASQGITTTRVLVDCGFSLRELLRRLQRAQLDAAAIDAVFITHEHGDHVGAALAFCTRQHIPLFTSTGTWRAIGNDDFDTRLLHLCQAEERLSIGDLWLQPFAVPHDANEPLQLQCGDGASKLGVITDVGSVSPTMLKALQGCDALLLECNHDPERLQGSSYPASLKRRILSSHGHLSNAQAADLLAACLHPRLRLVLAAHLSERNNDASLVQQALAPHCAQLSLGIANQAEGHAWLSLGGIRT